MSLSEKDVQTIAEFGLTNVQARVYLAAVQLKLASASQIAKFSRVRREDVYRSLPRLEQLGLVERVLGNPLRIRATPIDQALSMLIRNFEEETMEQVKTLEAKKWEVQQHLKFATETASASQEMQASFALLSTREAILNKVSSIVRETKREFNIVYSKRKLVCVLFKFTQELKQLVLRGARLRAISDLESYSESFEKIVEEQLPLKEAFEIRYVNRPLNHFLISDLKEALISTATEGDLAEHPCLWTNNKCVIDILYKSFEDYWHTATAQSGVTAASIEMPTSEEAKKLKPASHAIFLYDSLEDKHETLFSFLKEGLANNECAIYVASEETPEEIRTAMRTHGIDVDRHEETGALKILSYADVYLVNGEFNKEATINFWKKEYYQTLGKFAGLRVAGEATWFFKKGLEAELVNYEETLHKTFGIPMIAICAYNSKDLQRNKNGIALYSRLIAAHEDPALIALNHL